MAIIKLTPELFRQLDILARTKAACPLSVFDSEKEPYHFASFSFQPEAVYKHLDLIESPGCCCEKTFIKVSNRIDTEKFGQTRTAEIDFGAIPRDDIYKFLVFHEISHKLFDFCEWLLPVFRNGIAERNRFYAVNQIRADRYAWKTLYPRKRLPKRALNKEDKEVFIEAIKFMDLHKEWFPKEPRKVDPISINPKEMVPVSHIKNGIPWTVS